MKSICATLLLFAALSTAAQQRYELSFDNFHELKVVDGINVDYECNPQMAGKVVFETTPELAPAVIFEPSKTKLEIKLASRDVKYTNLPTIKVYSTYLTSVSNEGDSTVRVFSVAPGPKFTARLIGNGRLVVRDVKATNVDAKIQTGHGTIVLFGTTESAKLSLIGGSGQIQADELAANEVKCSILGTGHIFCYPLQTLNVSGQGSGTVFYRGTPALVKKGALVSVKVKSIDAQQ